ncbi:hypothetical protein ED733_002815 [Metarhizium rileyi]|uniref:Rho-GAP domain-containing protein n=1 Tax=Metarhizium rileyi (strain RCEF 4871) TaxID=1649241 RepID=A0A5C6GAV9_METRR|nr:hypothetical protein ED733_002815 [Metarhizium rileyi]
MHDAQCMMHDARRLTHDARTTHKINPGIHLISLTITKYPMAHQLGTSQSSQNLRAWAAYPPRRLPHSTSSVSLLLPQSASYHSFGHGSRVRSSGTWTTSSGEIGLLSNADEVDDRDVFVQEYNRLAKKHGVRLLTNDDFDIHQRGDVPRCPEKRGWLSRLLRSGPSHCPHNTSISPPPPQLRHKRSVSEFAHIIHCRRELPKVIEIQDMVRLSGKSMLYLPQEYSPCSLILPTCIRATAQHLAQNVATRGLFRVPGSSKVISALFDYYCFESGNANIASTVRCATLPLHIQYSVHDVASTFKRLLSVLPGGVLGSLALLDAFIAIHSHLNGEPEYPRTKQTKVRARLIALAIGTIKSQYRREMICAVFGLLSLIGRVAEVAPREDEDSRPLPTADLMGYNALGIVFGPLLVGDLLEQYTMQIATPSTGMLLFPLSPPRFRKDRRKSTHANTKTLGPPTVDKILIVNNITKMLISNWRDVVRQMKSLGTHCRKDTSTVDLPGKDERLQSPHGFTLRTSMNADEGHDGMTRKETNESEEPESPLRGQKKRRLKVLRRTASQRLQTKISIATLSPTKEESMGDDESSDKSENHHNKDNVRLSLQKAEENRKFNENAGRTMAGKTSQGAVEDEPRSGLAPTAEGDDVAAKVQSDAVLPQVYLESVPPRESSKKIASHDGTDGCLSQPASSGGRDSGDTRSDFSLSRQTPRTEQVSLASSVQSRTGGPPARCMSPVSPSFTGMREMPEGGIRMVQQSPVSNSDAERTQGGHLTLGIGTSYIAQDQGTQCDISPGVEERHSIDVTPERFYADCKLPAIEPRGLLGDGRQCPPPEKQRTVLHQPRLSRSYEHLRNQTTITLQSPTESTETKGLSKRGSVKAMAAMFETQTTGQHSPTFTEDSTAAHKGSKMASRDRHSKSDSAWTQQTFELAGEPAQSNSGGSTPKGHGIELHQVVRGILDDRLKGEFFDSEPDGSFQDATSYSPSKLLGKAGAGAVDGQTLKAVPSLGTMVPCREQPPIAHHLHLARPLSSPSPMQEPERCAVQDMVPTTQTSRPRSATVLYSQIRNLQRQLNAKTEEAAQLRRQLEAQKDSDVGTVSEQLRQAKRDVATWKDRADTAERRVKVFEKFAEKLKEIRDAISETNMHKAGDEGDNGSDQPPGNGSLGIRRAVSALKMAHEAADKVGAGKGDEATTVEGRMQKSSHGLSAAQDGTLDSDGMSNNSNTSDEQNQQKDTPCTCLATRMEKSSEQIWAVASELLRMRAEGTV